MKRPAEVNISALVAGVGALTFIVVALVRWRLEGGSDVLRLPISLGLAELVVGAGVLFRVRGSHLTAMIVFIVVGLLHLVIVLADGPVWARVVSGLLAVVHIYGVVLLNTGPARNYLGGPR